MKTIFFWMLSILVVTVGIAVAAVLIVKQSPSIRRMILTKVERRISDTTGTSVEIRDFRLTLFRLGLQVDGIVVHGRDEKPSLPLLRIESVATEIEVDSIYKRQWHLARLTIHRPVVRLSTNQWTESELSDVEANAAPGIAKTFDLAIQNFSIYQGELHVNGRKESFEAEAQNLHSGAEFDRNNHRYNGRLGYTQGTIRYADHAPLDTQLEARFTLTPEELSIEKLTLVAGQSQVALRGTVQNFSSPRVRGTYDAQFSGGDVVRLLNVSLPRPTGTIHVAGALNYTSESNRSFLQTAVVNGELSTSALYVEHGDAKIDVRILSAPFRLADGDFEMPNIRAQALDGSLSGTLTIHDIINRPQFALKANLQDASLENLKTKSTLRPLPEAHLSGKVSANAEATWATPADLTARIHASVSGSLGQNPSSALQGIIQANYIAARREIELQNSYLRTSATSITLNGRVSRYSQLDIHARSSDLHELELLSSNFRPKPSDNRTPKLDLRGSASFDGFITGLITEPQLQGKVEAHNLRAKGTSWLLLRAKVYASPSTLGLTGGHLEAVNGGQITFNLQAGLRQWAFSADSPINAEMSASGISITEIQQLTGSAYPVSGTLSGKLAVSGSQVNPVGNGSITVTGGQILSEPMRSLNVSFQGNGDTVHAVSLIQLSAGSARAQLTLDPKTQRYAVQAEAEKLRLEDLQTVKRRNLILSGAFSFNATGEGTVRSPELTAAATLSQLRLQDQPIPALTASLGLHGQIAEVTLNSETPRASIGRGTIEMKPPYIADLHLDTVPFSLQPFLAMYLPETNDKLKGEAELHAFLRGPLQDKNQLKGRVDIPILTASYLQFRIGAANAVRLEYTNGILTLAPVRFEGTGTDLHMQASIPVNAPETATYVVKGAVDLSVARVLQPGLNSGGRVQIDIDSRRHMAATDSIGELRVIGAMFHSTDLPLGLDNGNGVLSVSPYRLEVKTFEGQSGGGTVSTRGEVTLRPAIRFDFGVIGRNIRLRYPEGVRTILNSDLTFIGSQQQAILAGNITIEQLSLARDFDVTGLLSQHDSKAGSPPPGGMAERTKLNIDLNSRPQVNAVSGGVSVQGQANLHLVGTAAQPVILGRADLSGGDFFFSGNRFLLQSGAVDFVNPLRTEAVVNAQLSTRIDQYDIRVNVQGPFERLNTTYTSQPPLPPVRIISLLAFGHAREGGGNLESMDELGAQAVLARGLGATASSSVQRLAGLSYFSINPALGGNNQEAGARIVLQQRVTSNLVVTYSSDVTSTQRQAVQLEYKFSPRWSISGVRDQNGGLGATATFGKDF